MDSLLSQLYYCIFRILHIVDQHSPLAARLLLCKDLNIRSWKPRPMSRKSAGVTSALKLIIQTSPCNKVPSKPYKTGKEARRLYRLTQPRCPRPHPHPLSRSSSPSQSSRIPPAHPVARADGYAHGLQKSSGRGVFPCPQDTTR